MSNLTEARVREIIREEVRAAAREVVADALAGAFAKIQRGPSKFPLPRRLEPRVTREESNAS